MKTIRLLFLASMICASTGACTAASDADDPGQAKQAQSETSPVTLAANEENPQHVVVSGTRVFWTRGKDAATKHVMMHDVAWAVDDVREIAWETQILDMAADATGLYYVVADSHSPSATHELQIVRRNPDGGSPRVLHTDAQATAIPRLALGTDAKGKHALFFLRVTESQPSVLYGVTTTNEIWAVDPMGNSNAELTFTPTGNTDSQFAATSSGVAWAQRSKKKNLEIWTREGEQTSHVYVSRAPEHALHLAAYGDTAYWAIGYGSTSGGAPNGELHAGKAGGVDATLATDPYALEDIAADGDRVYVANDHGAIWSVRHDGSEHRLVAAGQSSIRSLFVDRSGAYWGTLFEVQYMPRSRM